jgi:hypothetical protein
MKNKVSQKGKKDGDSFLNITGEYIEYHNNINLNEFSDEQLKKERDKILKKKTPIEEKKKLIFLLAHNKNLWALYGIQKYLKKPDPELAEWAVIAWQECNAGILNAAMEKIGLNNKDDESIIMGGLGGNAKSLRYCFVLSKESGNFSDDDKNKLASALKEVSQKMKSKIEKVEFNKNYSRLVALVSNDTAVEDLIESAIEKMNDPLPILRVHYFVVNTHILSDSEIEEYLDGLADK